MNLFRRSVALTIGVDRYTDGVPQLANAVSDAEELARILKDHHHYDQVIPLFNENATGEALREAFTQRLSTELGPDDRVLIYFAGHGIVVRDAAPDEGPAGFILPQDARRDDRTTFLPMSEMYEALAQLPCRHVLLILDCCFAGAFHWSTSRHLVPLPGVLYKERFDRFVADPAWQVLTSASDSQNAYDTISLGERGMSVHSPFATALFEALMGAADLHTSTNPHGDGVITATELYIYLRDSVEIPTLNGQRQTPGIGPMNAFHKGGEYVFLVPDGELALPPAPPINPENNPYRGLRSFEVQDSDLFFGRTEVVQSLAAFVTQNPLTVVLGASGTGKSSLVKAGLLPYLQDSLGIKKESQFLLRPSNHSLADLRTLLPAYAGDTLAEKVSVWTAQHPSEQLVLVIDQFEELVTLNPDHESLHAVQTELADALTKASSSLRVILTLRSDFEPMFQDRLLRGFWQRFFVTPMAPHELREAIIGPAEVRALTFAPPRLVDQLVNEVNGMPGALPLLSFALEQLYIRCMERGEDRVLQEQDYKLIGGVTEALRNKVEGIYKRFEDSPCQATMRHLLLRMVAIEGNEITRRRVPVNELVYQASDVNERVEQILTLLIEERLLVRNQDLVPHRDSAGEQYIEPAHDALVRGWARLSMWIEGNEQKRHILLQREVTQAALSWEQRGRTHGSLWKSDPRLDEVNTVSRHEDGWLNQMESEFVQQSVQRRRFEEKRTISVLTVLSIIIAISAVFAWGQRQVAVDEANQRATEVVVRQTAQANAQNEADQRATAQADAEAEAERASNLADQSIAARQTAEAELELREAQVVAGMLDNEQISIETRLLLAVQSLARADNVEAGLRLRTLLDRYPWSFRVAQQPSAEPWDVGGSAVPDLELLAFSPNDTRLVASYYNTLILWDVRTTNIVGELDGEAGDFSSGTFTPDGRQLVTGEHDGDIRLWNIDSMREERTLQGHTTEVQRLSVSNDGTRVLSISEETTAHIQDLSGGSRIDLQAIGEAPVFASFARDDERVIVLDDETNGDGMIRLYDSTSGALLWRSTGAKRLQVDLSPDGKMLLAVQPAQFELFDTESGQLLRTIPAPEEGFSTASFADDGQQIITEGGNREWTRRWDAATGQSIAAARRQAPPYDPKRGHNPFEMGHAAIGLTTIATVNNTGEMRFWYPMHGQSWQRVPVEDWVRHLELLPDNQSLLVTTDTDIQHWRVGAEQPVFTITEHISPVTHLVISDDGQRALSASPDSVRVWNTDTGEMLNVIDVNEDETPPASLSPDGTRFVFAEGSTLRVIALADGQEHQIETTGFDILLAFSNDSQHLIFYDSWFNRGPIKMTLAGDTVWEADVTDIDIEQIVVSGDEENGIIAASTLVGNAIHLLDLESGEHIGRLIGHTDWVTDLALSEDGATLVSSGFDNTVRVWDVENLRLQSIVGEDMSDPVTISNDGRLLAVQDTIETIDIMFTQHRDLLPVAVCRIGRVLTPDERVSFGLESTSPDLVNPHTFQPISSDGCAPPDLPPAQNAASASMSAPEQQVHDFLNTFSDALNDPDITNARRLQEWLDRLTSYIHPDQRERFRIEAGVALTALVNLDIGAWADMPGSDIRLQMSFEVTETQLVEEEENHATVEVVDGIIATTLVGEDVTELGEHEVRMFAQRIPLSVVFAGEDIGNQTFYLELIDGTWYLAEPFAE